MTSSIVDFVSKIIKISKLKTRSAPTKYDTNIISDRPDFATMLLVILKFQNLKLSHDVIDLTCPKPNVSKMSPC